MVVGIVLAWPIVATIAPGFDDTPGKAELTVRLTRVMMPFLPLVSFAAVAMGMLNAEGRFGIPAFFRPITSEHGDRSIEFGRNPAEFLCNLGIGRGFRQLAATQRLEPDSLDMLGVHAHPSFGFTMG